MYLGKNNRREFKRNEIYSSWVLCVSSTAATESIDWYVMSIPA